MEFSEDDLIIKSMKNVEKGTAGSAVSGEEPSLSSEESGNRPRIRERTPQNSFDKYIQEGSLDKTSSDSDGSKITVIGREPALTPEETWDYSMKAFNKDMACPTIMIGENPTVEKLNLLNAFGECKHEMLIKTCCPCSTECKFSVCRRCYTVFCSKKCVKLAHESQMPLEASGAERRELENSSVPKSGGAYAERNGVAPDILVPDNRRSLSLQKPSLERKNVPTDKMPIPSLNSDRLPSCTAGKPDAGLQRSSVEKDRWNPTHIEYLKNKSDQSARKNNFQSRRTNQSNDESMRMEQEASSSRQIRSNYKDQDQLSRKSYQGPDHDRVLDLGSGRNNERGGGDFGNSNQIRKTHKEIERRNEVSSQEDYRQQLSSSLPAVKEATGSCIQYCTTVNQPHFFPVGPNMQQQMLRPKPPLLPNPPVLNTRFPQSAFQPSGYNTSMNMSPSVDPSYLQYNPINQPSFQSLPGYQINSPNQYAVMRMPIYNGGREPPVRLLRNPKGPVESEQPMMPRSPLNFRKSNGASRRFNPDRCNQEVSVATKMIKSDGDGVKEHWENRSPSTSSGFHVAEKDTPSQEMPAKIAGDLQKLTLNENKTTGTTTEYTHQIPEMVRKPIPPVVEKAQLPVINNSKTTNPVPNKVIAVSSADSDNKSCLVEGNPLVWMGVPFTAGYSFGDSIFDFYVWSDFGVRCNDVIRTEIENVKIFRPQKLLRKNKFCLAKFSNADCVGLDGWYRARISSVRGDIVTTYFIDYGNDEDVERAMICEMPDSLQPIRPSVIRIAIGDFQKFPQTTDEKLDECFEKYVLNEWIRLTVFDTINVDENGMANDPLIFRAKIEVKLSDDDETWWSFSEFLSEQGLGTVVSCEERCVEAFTKNDSMMHLPNVLGELNTEIEVKITSVSSPNDFFIIPISFLKIRDEIQTFLNASTFLEVEYLNSTWHETGYVCIAKRIDGQWARGKIIEVLKDELVKVQFLDFGDTAILHMQGLRAIPADLLKTPELACNCSLPIFPQTDGDWEPEQQQMFLDLITSPHKICIVAFDLEHYSNTYIVEVFLNKGVKGFAKSILKSKSERYYLKDGYEVDLDHRKKRKHKAVEVEAKPDPFSYKCLIPQLELNSVESETAFKITQVYSYNKVFIIPVKALSVELMKIQDEMLDIIEAGSAITSFPPVNTVVMVYYEDESWYRAVILKIIDHEQAYLRLVDLGYFITANISDIKPANERLMGFPRFGYEVVLDGIPEAPELLLWTDFTNFMNKAAMKVDYCIEKCTGDKEPFTVSLKVKGTGQFSKKSLSSLIMEKQIWGWEKMCSLNGYNNDKDLIEKSHWNSRSTSDDVQPLNLPFDVELEGELSRTTDNNEVFFINIEEQKVKREQDVLQNQIKRYVSKVTAEGLFPAIDDVFLLYLDESNPELKAMNLRGIGKWNRCIRPDKDYYQNIDLDESYPVSAELSNHFIFRRMWPEFLRVPAGVAQCRLNFDLTAKMQEFMDRELQGCRIKFTVDTFHQKDYIHIISSPDLKDRLKYTGK